MGDKAGKMFTMPQKKGVKSSLKSSSGKEGTLKVKDDSSVRSKKGRKVQFDAGVAEADLNFSSKYGGKGDTPTTFPKGKGDRTFSSGKSSVPKTAPPLELRVEDGLSWIMVSRMVRWFSEPKLLGTWFLECIATILTSNLWLQICVIADVCLETADEVFALVLSLKPMMSEHSEPVNKVLLELAKLKQSTPNHKM